jgi:hypothetical protein
MAPVPPWPCGSCGSRRTGQDRASLAGLAAGLFRWHGGALGSLWAVLILTGAAHGGEIVRLEVQGKTIFVPAPEGMIEVMGRARAAVPGVPLPQARNSDVRATFLPEQVWRQPATGGRDSRATST